VGKNVAVFVDVANIFYAAKAAGVDIDYVTLLKSAVAGRDFVRAYAYTGLDPENENQRNFHSFLARHGYRVVSKDIRKYGDGKVKANLDIELVVDLMKTARNLDVAIIVSGDGDFAPAIRAVQEMGVRCEVISFRGNTSSDLIDVADLFTDITQIARVEKGSSRSGRRVAGDEADLSMTEVPDKQTEGTGRGRGRTGRGRGRVGEAEPVAAATRTGRGRGRAAAGEPEPAAAAGGGSLIALPGEKLSRVRPEPAAIQSAEDELAGAAEELEPIGEPPLIAEGEETDGDGRRRRRRRGGRGRGRGRGREEQAETVVEAAPAAKREPLDDEIEEPPPARRSPRAAAFGSVWDTQMGVPRQPTSPSPLPPEEEFDDEPAIPEYLIAERRGMTRGATRGPIGGRGGRARSGYSAAVDRERYGRGGGGGINRYPDVSGRTGVQPRVGRDGGRQEERYGRSRDRDDRVDRPDRGRGRGPQAGGGAPRPGEQWSEVPPELEALLRAQLAAKGGPAGAAQQSRAPDVQHRPADAGEQPAEQSASRTTDRGRGRPRAAAPAEPASATEAAAAAAPKRRPGRPRKTAEGSATATTASATTESAPPRRRTSRTRATAADGGAPAGQPPPDEAAATAPRRRAARTRTATPAAATDAADATESPTVAAPKRRTSRTSTGTASES
jgi:uncharacterized LabA/DUF88 family protein